MHINARIGLVCCSDGLDITDYPEVEQLVRILENHGLSPVLSPCIYRRKNEIRSGTARERAQALMDFYCDHSIREIFDISGGDLASEILPWLDYGIIAKARKQFWGYSDLTSVINAVYSRTGQPSVLYQIRHIARPGNEERLREFTGAVLQEDSALFSFPYEMIQGESMEGVIIGGNIRCLLKLAGTPYWPDMTGKILFLESRSGTVPRMTAFLSQLQQIGVFGMVRGVVLGNFTQMEQEHCRPGIIELLQEIAGKELPLARTLSVGHQVSSKAVIIGSEGRFARA